MSWWWCKKRHYTLTGDCLALLALHFGQRENSPKIIRNRENWTAARSASSPAGKEDRARECSNTLCVARDMNMRSNSEDSHLAFPGQRRGFRDCTEKLRAETYCRDTARITWTRHSRPHRLACLLCHHRPGKETDEIVSPLIDFTIQRYHGTPA
jgi:hypothetical protein